MVYGSWLTSNEMLLTVLIKEKKKNDEIRDVFFDEVLVINCNENNNKEKVNIIHSFYFIRTLFIRTFRLRLGSLLMANF